MLQRAAFLSLGRLSSIALSVHATLLLPFFHNVQCWNPILNTRLYSLSNLSTGQVQRKSCRDIDKYTGNDLSLFFSYPKNVQSGTLHLFV